MKKIREIINIQGKITQFSDSKRNAFYIQDNNNSIYYCFKNGNENIGDLADEVNIVGFINLSKKISIKFLENLTKKKTYEPKIKSNIYLLIPLPIFLLCYCIYGIIDSFQYSYGSLILPIYIIPMIYVLPIFCALIAKEIKKKRYLKTYITGCKKLDNIANISDNNKDTKLIQLENKAEFCGMCGKKKNSKMVYCPDCGNKL